MPQLDICVGGRPSFIYPLTEGENPIGRDTERCAVPLKYSSISRVHIIVRIRRNRIFARDTSGGYALLNGKPLPETEVELAHGDELDLGDVVCRVNLHATSTANEPTDRRVRRSQHAVVLRANVRGVESRVATLTPAAGGHRLLLDGDAWAFDPGTCKLRRGHGVDGATELRVQDGRVRVFPGTEAALVDGVRLTAPRDLQLGDVLRVGPHTWTVGEAVVSDVPGEDEEVNAFGDLAGRDPATLATLDLLARIAPSRLPVLITGETGTGKSAAARAIHEFDDPEKPLVYVNIAAVSPSLFQSEVFGHSKGAFTGASEPKSGYFLQADGGTLVIDEIGELGLTEQAALLSVLDTGLVQVLGGGTREVEVRVIAATNVDLVEAVRAKRFREDLYNRLNVLMVHLPPLRERPLDIPFLARRTLRALRPDGRFTKAAEELLQAYAWPGNVRELLAAVQRGVQLSTHPSIVDAPDLGLPAPPPRPARGRKSRNGEPPVSREALLALVGLTLDEIGARLGVVASTARRWLQHWGLPTDSRVAALDELPEGPEDG